VLKPLNILTEPVFQSHQTAGISSHWSVFKYELPIDIRSEKKKRKNCSKFNREKCV